MAIVVGVVPKFRRLFMRYFLFPFWGPGHLQAVEKRITELESKLQKVPDIPSSDAIKFRRNLGFHLNSPYECFCSHCYYVDKIYKPLARSGVTHYYCRRCSTNIDLSVTEEKGVRIELEIPEAL